MINYIVVKINKYYNKREENFKMSELTLRMPSNYVNVEREEMEYVDGGGFYYMDNTAVVGFVSSFIQAGGIASLASVGLLTVDIAGAAGTIAAMIPGIGWAAALFIAANAAAFSFACINAVIQGKGVDIGIQFPTGFSFTVR